MSNKIKILFILPSLKAGGAERVVSNLARTIDRNYFSTKLIIVGFEKDTVYNTEDIEVVYLNKSRVLKSVIPLFTLIKNEKPNIVMSSIGHVNLIMAIFSFFFTKCKFIGRQASVVSEISNFTKSKSIHLPRWLTAILYRRLDMIVCQSRDMANDLEQLYNLNPKQLTIINNPISIDFKTKKKESINVSCPKFINIGRISPEKGQDRIIDVMADLKGDFKLTIIGSGSGKNALENKVAKYGLNEKIMFVDYSDQINRHLCDNDIFVQGSYVEGFPNALLEAIASGLPVIAFDAPGGTKEIIQNTINGYIVDNHTDFVKTLEKMITIQWDSSKIRASVIEKFHPLKIIGAYENLFQKVLHTNK